MKADFTGFQAVDQVHLEVIAHVGQDWKARIRFWRNPAFGADM